MARKSLYTKEPGAKVASRAQASPSGRYHIMSGEDSGWAVVPAGTVRAEKSFPTQKEAVLYAKNTASKKEGEVFVHTKSGQVKDIIFYAKKVS